MSIKKLNFTNVINNKVPFTTFMNIILQNIHDGMAQAIWTFLSSLPPNWEVNKAHLMKHFQIGRDKLDKHLTHLKNIGLIEFFPNRRIDGTVEKWSIVVNAESPYFNQFIHTTENQYSGENPPVDNSPSTILKNHPVDKPPSGKSDTYKRNTHSVKTTDHKKTEGVPVFSVIEDLVKHRLGVANIPITEDLVSQILFYLKTKPPAEAEKYTNIAVNLVKDKKWNIPNGWEGITSKSIAEKEAAYNRQKEIDFIEDGKAIRALKTSKSFAEAKKESEEEMSRLGLSPSEYYHHVLTKSKNNINVASC